MINRITGKAKLARTSSTPGKTQSINFYRIDNAFYFVDLPGYGYAKAAKSAVEQWKKLIDQYFENRSTIVLVIQLVDSRLPPTHLDLRLSEWLANRGLPRMIVATKTDKLSNNQRNASMRVLANAFGAQSVVMSSAETGAGFKEIWKHVQQVTAGSESTRE